LRRKGDAARSEPGGAKSFERGETRDQSIVVVVVIVLVMIMLEVKQVEQIADGRHVARHIGMIVRRRRVSG
jgi:hypothetical protein